MQFPFPRVTIKLCSTLKKMRKDKAGKENVKAVTINVYAGIGGNSFLSLSRGHLGYLLDTMRRANPVVTVLNGTSYIPLLPRRTL